MKLLVLSFFFFLSCEEKKVESKLIHSNYRFDKDTFYSECEIKNPIKVDLYFEDDLEEPGATLLSDRRQLKILNKTPLVVYKNPTKGSVFCLTNYYSVHDQVLKDIKNQYHREFADLSNLANLSNEPFYFCVKANRNYYHIVFCILPKK